METLAALKEEKVLVVALTDAPRNPALQRPTFPRHRQAAALVSGKGRQATG